MEDEDDEAGGEGRRPRPQGAAVALKWKERFRFWEYAMETVTSWHDVTFRFWQVIRMAYRTRIARVTQVPSDDKWRPDDARSPSRIPDLAQVSSSLSSSIRLSLF